MNVDAFSDVLRLINAQSVVSGGLRAGGDWAVRFPPPDHVKFFIAARGMCWLSVDGDEPIRFSEGETLLLTASRGFSLASDPALPTLDATALYGDDGNLIPNLGTGETFFLLGGHVRLDSAGGELLIDGLPPVIHVRGESTKADAIQWLVSQLVEEHCENRPGSHFAVTQFAQLIFLNILRAYLASVAAITSGRLRATSDPRIGPAIRLMHANPGRAWHLKELAKACAMSRTVFASYFKTVAGVAPLTYLTQWRMQLAERALRESNASLSEVSDMLGYSSESAFSVAFKRVMGKSPKRYRSAMRSPLVTDLIPPEVQ